jgi:hypothetical protein
MQLVPLQEGVVVLQQDLLRLRRVHEHPAVHQGQGYHSTPGCQIGYVLDHTGCHQLNRVLKLRNNVVKSANPRPTLDPTGCHQLNCLLILQNSVLTSANPDQREAQREPGGTRVR